MEADLSRRSSGPEPAGRKSFTRKAESSYPPSAGRHARCSINSRAAFGQSGRRSASRGERVREHASSRTAHQAGGPVPVAGDVVGWL